MAYKVIILYRLYMPSYVLGTFTEYPDVPNEYISGLFIIQCTEYYKPFFFASFHTASISSNVMSVRFRPCLMVCSSK